MEAILEKKKRKRLPQSKRRHLRRIKQEARRDNISEADLKKKLRQT